MNTRNRTKSILLLSFCIPFLCFCAGCLESGSPVPGTEVSVSVAVPSGGYGVYMSSTVGILLQPVLEGAGAGNFSCEWQCDGGQFLTWNPPDYRVTEHGTSLLQNSSGTVYWNPLVPVGDEASLNNASPVTVTLQVYDSDGKPVSQAAPVTIGQSEDGLWYAN